MRTLGLDIGEKRIGVAVSDESGEIALPVKVLPRDAVVAQAIEDILEIARSRGAQKIVVGMPTKLNGQPGLAAQQMSEFAQALGRSGEVEVVLWDERLTTAMAEKTMIAADVKRHQRRQHIDKVAATLILQNYLDAHANDHRH